MADFVKPSISLVDESLDKNNTEQYRLSIRLALDGFSFCVLNSQTNKYLAFELFQFPISPGHVLASNLSDAQANFIDGILYARKWLLQPFESVHVVLENSKATLIPFPLFEAGDKDLYLKFNHYLRADEQVVYDKLNNLEAYNVYALPPAIRDKVFSFFPRCNFSHFSSTLIESLIIRYKNQDLPETIFANVRSNHFDMVGFRDQKMVYFNSFAYRTKEDFTYFLIFVMEQLSINPENVRLVLMGEIERRSPVFETIYTYVRNVSFIDRNEAFEYSYVFDRIPDHYYYNLLNVNLCGL
ncbi:MAG: DUF3822 family protein [Bacteroidales bacterium]|nr:DUF3822 family protein [Bacteroidales bacterium]